MQGVAALEQLQVAGFEDEGADAVAPVVEHGLHGLVVLVFGRAQRGDVFELTPGITVLDRQRNGEVVGVEVPGEARAFFGEVDDDVGERVGIGKERLLAQCSADEVGEGRPGVDRAQGAVRAEIVSGNEGVGAVVKPAQRVALRQIVAVFGEVGIGPAERAVGQWRHPVGFFDHGGEDPGADEALQHAATKGVEVALYGIQRRAIAR